jgi:hypothetical protein
MLKSTRMKNKIPSAIAIIVLVIISSLYFEKSQAQSIQLIANPDSGYVEDPGIIYKTECKQTGTGKL